MNYFITHTSEITGSTWEVLFDKDFDVKDAVIKTKSGKEIKVKISKRIDWMLWMFFNGKQSFSDFKIKCSE